MLPLEKNLRYVPLRCHFLHFEITVNGKMAVEAAYWPLSHQCITPPKVITGSCSDAKRVKMAEKSQKNSKESC